MARHLILISLPPGTNSHQWKGDWYLQYSANGSRHAAIAYRHESSGRVSVVLIVLEREDF